MIVDFLFFLAVLWCAMRFIYELKIDPLSLPGMFVILTTLTITMVWNQG